MDFYQFPTSLGLMALASEGDFITHLYLPSYPTPRLASHPTPLLLEGERQLLEYLGGQRKTFNLPLNPQGTPFQRRVWQCLCQIPYGQVISYRELAAQVGSPRAFQAVGQANGRNPLPILIPCHRVIAADGTLGGYASGVEHKAFLLRLEGVRLPEPPPPRRMRGRGLLTR